MDDVIRVHDRYYILATSGLSDDRTRVLKHGDTFAVFDRHGDVQPIGLGQQGVFDRGTRGLSRFDVRVAGTRPLLLSSTLDRENAILIVSATNPDLQRAFFTDCTQCHAQIHGSDLPSPHAPHVFFR